MLENNPIAYKFAKGKAFNLKVFLSWGLKSIIHVTILFIVSFYASKSVDADGMTNLWLSSTIVFYAVAIVPSLLVVFLMENFTLVHFLSIFPCSLGSIFLFSWLLNFSESYNPDLYGVINQIYTSATAWLILLIACSIPLLMELAIRGIRRHLRPSFTEILQEKYREIHLQSEKVAEARHIPLSELKKQAGLASKMVVIDPTEEIKWSRITRQASESQVSISLHDDDTKKSDKFRQALTMAMMRFKGFTGGMFSSASNTSHLADYDEYDSNLVVNKSSLEQKHH